MNTSNSKKPFFRPLTEYEEKMMQSQMNTLEQLAHFLDHSYQNYTLIAPSLDAFFKKLSPGECFFSKEIMPVIKNINDISYTFHADCIRWDISLTKDPIKHEIPSIGIIQLDLELKETFPFPEIVTFCNEYMRNNPFVNKKKLASDFRKEKLHENLCAIAFIEDKFTTHTFEKNDFEIAPKPL